MNALIRVSAGFSQATLLALCRRAADQSADPAVELQEFFHYPALISR
jgi:hypothetical protein